MKNLLFCLVLLFIGCETYTLTMTTKTGRPSPVNYTLIDTDFLADSVSTNGEIPSSAAIGSIFKKGNITCAEFIRESDGYIGCCCDGQFSRKVLDRIHRCGH